MESTLSQAGPRTCTPRAWRVLGGAGQGGGACYPAASWLEGRASVAQSGAEDQAGLAESSPWPARSAPSGLSPCPQLQGLFSSYPADHSLSQALCPQLPEDPVSLSITRSSIAPAHTH